MSTSSSSSSSSSSASSSDGEGEIASGHEGKDEATSGNDDQQENAASADDGCGRHPMEPLRKQARRATAAVACLPCPLCGRGCSAHVFDALDNRCSHSLPRMGIHEWDSVPQPGMSRTRVAASAAAAPTTQPRRSRSRTPPPRHGSAAPEEPMQQGRATEISSHFRAWAELLGKRFTR